MLRPSIDEVIVTTEVCHLLIYLVLDMDSEASKHLIAYTIILFRFTDALGAAGNWRMNGLKTAVDKYRYADGCLDWMLK